MQVSILANMDFPIFLKCYILTLIKNQCVNSVIKTSFNYIILEYDLIFRTNELKKIREILL